MDESYTIEVQNWDLTYSFGLNNIPKFIPGSFIESLDLKIMGMILQPKKYEAKEIKVTFVGDRSLISKITEEENFETKPNGIGSITLRGEQREFLGFLPIDVLPTVDSMLESKRIRFLTLYGSALTRGHAYIKYLHFLKSYEPEEE